MPLGGKQEFAAACACSSHPALTLVSVAQITSLAVSHDFIEPVDAMESTSTGADGGTRKMVQHKFKCKNLKILFFVCKSTSVHCWRPNNRRVQY